MHYDYLRRENKQYLSYVPNDTNKGAFRVSAKNDQEAFYNAKYTGNSGYSYREDIYEASPLNRVAKIFNVGVTFRGPNEKKSTFAYGANTDSEVMLLRVDASDALTRAGNYREKSLHKTTVTNEDGAVTSSYTDMTGRVVMERILEGTKRYDTYYVYDRRGNLRYVLPPKLVALKTSTTTSFADTDADMKALAYVYKYDEYNRCIEKRIPGAESIYMIYDRSDRVVMAQDGNQRASSSTQPQWLYNKYDNLNRLVSQSLVRNTKGVDLSILRSHFDTVNAVLPPSFSVYSVLVENEYDGQ